jgi:hypothetical protein
MIKNNLSKKTENITINNKILQEKQLAENFEAIQNYKIKDIKKDYLCSTCDPVLSLVCEIFQCSIWNNYCGTRIRYEHAKSKFCIFISNDNGHMHYNNTNKVKK